MVVFSPFVPFLCTLWEPCARFFNRYSAFTDQKKKNNNNMRDQRRQMEKEKKVIIPGNNTRVPCSHNLGFLSDHTLNESNHAYKGSIIVINIF